MNKPTLTVDQLFEYRKILKEKEGYARASGDNEMLKACQNRVTMVDVILDDAFMGTATAALPTLNIDFSMFKPVELKKLLPMLNLAKLPTQGLLDFNVKTTEQVLSEEEARKAKKKSKLGDGAEDAVIIIPTTAGTEREIEILKLISSNVTKNIPSAIDLAREEYGMPEAPNFRVYEKIRELAAKEKRDRNVSIWEASIAQKVIELGPVYAFFHVKKHLAWNNIDISLLIESAVRGRFVEEPAKLEHGLAILENGNSKVRMKEYLEDERISGIVKEMLGDSKEKPVVPQQMYQLLGELTKSCVPSKRKQLLKRKEYVEKGY